MEEFIAYMMHMSPSPRSLEIFVNSYWRHRMSDIYAVDLKEIKDIKNCLVGTKTCKCSRFRILIPLQTVANFLERCAAGQG